VKLRNDSIHRFAFLPATPNKSLDASGGSVFRNLLGAAEGALIRAAASTQRWGAGIALSEPETN